MKTQLLVTCLFLVALNTRAQNTNNWLTLNGGGGVASSANYILNYTLGQPAVDANQMTSANYTFIGGFWAVANVSSETVLPKLLIAHTSATTVKVWWPSPSAGFVLEVNTSINNPGGWGIMPAGTAVTDDGTTRSVIVSSVNSPRFYRLRKN